MDGRPTWTDYDEAGDYAVPNVLSPRDLVFRPDNMDETVPHTKSRIDGVCEYWFQTKQCTHTHMARNKETQRKKIYCLRSCTIF